MSYPDQAPPRRPAAVVAAAAVLVLMAVGAGLYAVTGLLVMAGTTDRFRSAAATTGAGTGEIDGVVALLRAATVLSAVVGVLVGLVLVGLALGLLAGRSGARVTTWVVCGLGLLCGCGALAVLVGQRAAPLRLGADQRVTADLLAQLGDAYPGWWIPLNAALSVAQVLGYLVVAALLTLPAANAFFHRRPAGPRPPAGPTPPGYGATPAYGPLSAPPAYGPLSAPPAYGPPSAPPGPTPPSEDRP
ncbi:hypothetical protein DLE60_13405 [Micromonospora globispora]|uniref:hypothetical protein n=1 Tax=Micromonospora globispora TaxID=1450148 RepID=UPI000D701850|nr:hypothetical protein [Micromonospora globispora]PWU60013.1 hypothetical protein DLE60_13405 [Micromonospora globispora]RQW97005.1 hypothetical protein DKL51_12655 [Micromonospora globispora]